jgi:hypothetical protein
MIVNWTNDNQKIIPAHVPTELDPSSTSRFCVLAPGYNDVPDELWKDARTFVTDDIKSGRIVEEWVKEARPEKAEDFPILFKSPEDERDTKNIFIPAGIRDINRPMVIEKVVKGTFLPSTLKKWAREENRPDVQAALTIQIDAVEKGLITG